VAVRLHHLEKKKSAEAQFIFTIELESLMLINSKDLKGYKLGTEDGNIGKVKEILFDDKHWTVRYLVADTGGWLTGRQVLIAPYGLESIDTENQIVQTNLTRKQIESSPSLDSDRPVSQQFEETYYGYYGWPVYWSGFNSWGMVPYVDRSEQHKYYEGQRHWDPTLRSTRVVTGYHVHARDGQLGHVKDFIIDDENWAIRYLVVDTGNWLSDKKVLISPLWIDNVSWDSSSIFTSLSRQEIKTAPEFSEQALLNRVYEANLHGHYGRENYWDAESTNLHTSFPTNKNTGRGESRPRY
jgi:uncharacterized protein YrrD